MMGFQAAGAAPLVSGTPVAQPKTVATAIRIGNPASWRGATGARDESRGAIEAIDDDGILAAYRLLARTEGIFAEPASAISIAGALRLAETGRLKAGDLVVCTLTGHGLKDPDNAIASADPPVTIPADRAKLAAILELE
jgi:threonine synthase